jgi:hypothetical protein
MPKMRKWRQLNLPADDDLKAEVEKKIVGLGKRGKKEFWAEIAKLRSTSSPESEFCAVFNGRYHVTIRRPSGGPIMVLAHDGQKEEGTLADVSGRWPMAHEAAERCAKALKLSVETLHVFRTR